MVRIPFQWLENAIECFQFVLNGLDLHSNLVRTVQICIQILRIPFEWLEFAFECFKFGLNGSKLNSIGQIPFEWL